MSQIEAIRDVAVIEGSTAIGPTERLTFAVELPDELPITRR